MLVRSAARIAAFTLSAAALLVIGATAGRAETRPRKHIFDDLITPSMLAPPAAPSRPHVSTARFFSINRVLARLDNKLPTDEPIRLASLGDDRATDVPSLPLHGTEEPFALLAFRAPEGPVWRKWRGVEADIRADMIRVFSCRDGASGCSPAARRFALMIDEVRGHAGRAQLEIANRLINTSIRYMSDLNQHGAVDVWSAPLASLESGRGDCEDYAIAKYVLLQQAGVPEHDLRLLLVRDRAVREDHAVLAVRTDQTWLVLDNRRSILAADSELPQFAPLYALNRDGVSLFASPYLSQLDPGVAWGGTPASAAEDATHAAPDQVTTVATTEIVSADLASGVGTVPFLL